MCNLYTQSKSVDEIARLFADLQIPLSLPEGAPNLAERDIAITDPGPIVRATPAGGYELVIRRWSWPAPNGKPVYNFRSDGREFSEGRCLIVADGFYEFTAPAEPKQKRKDRWLFELPDRGLMGIAGLIRDDPGRGEAFTMLTVPPGPDILPYHHRGVAVVRPGEWRAWLDGEASALDLLGASPAGSLAVTDATRRD
jgi:putative SOS response-associated peptidase YedK